MGRTNDLPLATAISVDDVLIGIDGSINKRFPASLLPGFGATPINVQDPAYGAVGDARFVVDGVIGAGTLSTLTSATAVFTSADVGKAVTVERAGVAGVTGNFPHSTTIAGYTNATTVTLTAAAVNAAGVTAARVELGTDDSAEFQAAITAALATGGPKAVYVPPGRYMVPTTLTIAGSLAFRGAGRGFTTIVHSSWSRGVNITAPNGSYVELEDFTIQGPTGVTPHQTTTYSAIVYEVSSGFDSRFSVRRVNAHGTFDSAVSRSGGGLFELIDCHLEGTDGCASAFEGTDTSDSMFLLARGCTLTCPNGDFTTDGSVGFYIHPHVPFKISDCRFISMGRYGIYENGTHTAARRSALVSNCQWVDAEIIQAKNNGRTVLTGCSARGSLSGLGSTLREDDVLFGGCTFENCAPFFVENGASFTGCTFINVRVVVANGTVTPAGQLLQLAGCRFRTTTIGGSSSSGRALHTTGSTVVRVVISDCEFYDVTSSGTLDSAITLENAAGQTWISNSRFRVGSNNGYGVITMFGTKLVVNGCEFDSPSGVAVLNTSVAGVLEGSGNRFIGAGLPSGGSGSTTAQQRLVRRPGVNPTTVASAATIDTNVTAWLNYDTHVVSGSAAIATLSNPWVAVGAVKLVVAAGATWSTVDSGNITPLSTTARAAGSVVTLLWEPTAAKWLETGAAGGGGDPTMGGDLTGTASNAQYAAGSIVNADINGSAAIALSKLASDPLARANHTGTQLAATVSDLAATVGSRTFKTGLYYIGDAGTSDSSDGFSAQSDEHAVRFDVGVATTFDQIGLVVVTAGTAGGKLRLGIRQDSGFTYPSTLILDAGQVDSDSTGTKVITISQLLNPGRYWLTVAVQVGAPALRTLDGDPYIGSTTGDSALWRSYKQTGVSGALPSPFSSTVTLSSFGPRVFLRAA